MANILFIDRGIPNIGIAYMSSYLNKHNHNVHYFRASLKSMFVPNLEIEIDSYITDVLHEKVDIFCISIMAINWSWVKEKVKILKQKYPSIPVLVGGPFATTSPDVILNYSEVDYVCIGDGEKPLLDIANSIDLGSLSTDIVDICNISFKDNNVPVIKDMTFYVNNLDDYPFPDFSIFEGQFSKHYFKYPGIITSRGCPFSCTYCTCPGLKEIYSKVGNFVRQHSVEYMIEYLSKLKIDYGCKSFIVNDDIFFLNKEWLRKFAHEYKKKVNIPITCLGNPNCVDDEVATLLHEVGCKLVIFGLQSGSEAVRRKIKRFETNQKVIQMANSFKKANVHFSINHIFDFPFEDIKSIYESACLYNEIRPNMIDPFSLVYFPKAEIVKDAVQLGYLTKKEEELIELGEVSGQVNPYNTKRDSNYKRYNLFYNMIPLMPKAFVDFILVSQERFIKFSKLLSYMPGFTAAFVKLILAFKNRTQFIQLSFLPDLIYYFKRKLLCK